MVREPLWIISAVTGLTVSGRVGDLGLRAPSHASERMVFMGRNLASVRALRLDTEERIVTQQGLNKSRPVQDKEAESLTVQLMATGQTGSLGSVIDLAEEEDS